MPKRKLLQRASTLFFVSFPLHNLRVVPTTLFPVRLHSHCMHHMPLEECASSLTGSSPALYRATRFWFPTAQQLLLSKDVALVAPVFSTGLHSTLREFIFPAASMTPQNVACRVQPRTTQFRPQTQTHLGCREHPTCYAVCSATTLFSLHCRPVKRLDSLQPAIPPQL